ncbi:MAG: serine hydrolase [Patescibacteria group bacterium]
MRFQALLLSLIILVSFLITGINSPEKSSVEKNSVPEMSDDSSSFIKDIYLAFEEKLTLTNNNFIERINQNTNFIKQIASANFSIFFSKFELGNNYDNPISLAAAETALISETKINRMINLLPLVCDSEIPQLTVKAALVKHINPLIISGKTIFELNSKNRWPIASLTKLMTSIIAIEKIDSDKKITMSAKAIATEGIAGNFKVGEIYKVGDLIKAMLITSSNDAAMAIVENFGEIEFIDEMQKKTAELKMFQTSYLEPTGLSFINQSTANDLTKLINYVYQKHPELLEISRQKEAEIFELKSKKIKNLLNVNKFAGEQDFIGGKTGYIEEAGRNLIALFNINGKIILSIVLGADDSFIETKKIKEFIQNCK